MSEAYFLVESGKDLNFSFGIQIIGTHFRFFVFKMLLFKQFKMKATLQINLKSSNSDLKGLKTTGKYLWIWRDSNSFLKHKSQSPTNASKNKSGIDLWFTRSGLDWSYNWPDFYGGYKDLVLPPLAQNHPNPRYLHSFSRKSYFVTNITIYLKSWEKKSAVYVV